MFKNAITPGAEDGVKVSKMQTQLQFLEGVPEVWLKYIPEVSLREDKAEGRWDWLLLSCSQREGTIQEVPRSLSSGCSDVAG